jgi:hypothetical protein
MDQCVYESDRFEGGSVMVWAGICHDGRTQLKIVQGTLKKIMINIPDNKLLMLDIIEIVHINQRLAYVYITIIGQLNGN